MTSNRKVIDLFCGVGGLSLGAHLAGFTTALAVDIDANLTSSFADNFPGSKVLLKNIADLSGHALLSEAGLKKTDSFGVVGGPPCQGFSLMGRRDLNDPRNTLIGHFFRIVRETKPAFFLMENVPGILLGSARTTLDNAMSDLKGYNVLGPMRIDASNFGAATKRERVIVIGIRDGKIKESDLGKYHVDVQSTVRCAISDLPEPSDDGWGRYLQLETIPDYAVRAREIHQTLGTELLKVGVTSGRVSGVQPTEHTTKVRRRFAKVLPGKTDETSRCPRLSWDQLAPTLRAGTGPDHGSFQSIRPIHPKADRVITVREAARIQGFPDWFKFHDTKWHSFRMIGNSVSPKMAHGVLHAISARL